MLIIETPPIAARWMGHPARIDRIYKINRIRKINRIWKIDGIYKIDRIWKIDRMMPDDRRSANFEHASQLRVHHGHGLTPASSAPPPPKEVGHPGMNGFLDSGFRRNDGMGGSLE